MPPSLSSTFSASFLFLFLGRTAVQIIIMMRRMLPSCQCHKIFWSVIIRSSIDMMNNFRWSEASTVSLLPNQTMFQHIASMVRSGMIWCINHFVAIFNGQHKGFASRYLAIMAMYEMILFTTLKTCKHSTSAGARLFFRTLRYLCFNQFLASVFQMMQEDIFLFRAMSPCLWQGFIASTGANSHMGYPLQSRKCIIALGGQ